MTVILVLLFFTGDVSSVGYRASRWYTVDKINEGQHAVVM